jgi:hypothetical protein
MHTKRQSARGECCKSQFNQGRERLSEERGETESFFHDYEGIFSWEIQVRLQINSTAAANNRLPTTDAKLLSLQKVLQETTDLAGLFLLRCGPILASMIVALNFPTSRAGAGRL